MKIYFATKNMGKVNSVQAALSQYGIELIQVQIELPEPRSYNLMEIAREKVKFAFEQIKKPCIALDAGFYINSLNGFPRSFVNLALETIGLKGMLKLVEDLARDCEFRNCLAYLDETMEEPVYFESDVRGRLSMSPSGEYNESYHWSKLFQIFIPYGKEKTLAEMSFKEYNEWRSLLYSNSFATRFGEWVSKRVI